MQTTDEEFKGKKIEETRKKIREKIRKTIEREHQLEEERLNRERKWAKYVIDEEVVRKSIPAKTMSDVVSEEAEQGKVPIILDKKTIVFEKKKK